MEQNQKAKVYKYDEYINTKKKPCNVYKFKRYGPDLELCQDQYLNSPVYNIGNDCSYIDEYYEYIKTTYNKNHNLVKGVNADANYFEKEESKQNSS